MKSTKVLELIHNRPFMKLYAGKVSKMIDMTNSHVVKTLKLFEDMGLMVSRKKGKNRYYEMTDKGKEVGDSIRKIREIVGVAKV